MKKMYLKRALSLALALLMVLALVACGGTTSTPPATSSTPPATSSAAPSTSADPGTSSTPAEVKYKERLVIVNSSIMIREDPASSNTGTNAHIYEMTHNTLIDYDANTNEVFPELAHEWDVSDDGLVYTFKLRDDVKFHNGTDFNAEDVLYSFEHAKASSYQATKFEDVEKIEAVDNYTVKITLSSVNSNFMRYLSSGFLSIICKEAIDADPDHGYKIGTGAYIQTEWVPDDHVTVTRNEDYWGELPKTKIIEYRAIAEGAARAIGMQTGEYDICLAVPAGQIHHLEEDEDLTVINRPGTNLHYLGINMLGKTNPALLDVRVRAALNYATNHEDLVLVMTEGYGSAPHGVIPQTAYGYSDKVNAPSYDIEKAKALLAEAGYPNGLTVSLTTNAASWPNLFELLQSMWAPAGINLVLDTDDRAVRSERIKTQEYDLISGNWTFSNTSSILNTMWNSKSSSNRSLIADPYIDEMLVKLVREPNEAKLLENYAELSQYLTDTHAIIPMYIASERFAYNKNLEGAVLNSAADVTLTYAYIVEK